MEDLEALRSFHEAQLVYGIMAFIDDIIVTLPAEPATNVEGIDDVTFCCKASWTPLRRSCSEPSRVLDPLAVGQRSFVNSLGTDVRDPVRQTGLTVSERAMGVVRIPIRAESYRREWARDSVNGEPTKLRI